MMLCRACWSFFLGSFQNLTPKSTLTVWILAVKSSLTTL